MPQTTPEIFLGPDGVQFDHHAVFRDTRTIDLRGRFVQIRILNNSGRLRLTGIQVEAEAGSRKTQETS